MTDVEPGGPAVAPTRLQLPTQIEWEVSPPAPGFDDYGDQLVDADVDGELFGAAFPTGAFDPVPVVAIDGVDVASGPGPDGVPDGLLVVDGLTVRWGRSEVLDQPEPSTGTLQLFDPSRTWAVARDVDGLPVTIRWEGLADGTPTAEVFLRGRVGRVTVRRHTVRLANGERVRGSLVTLPLRSILADAANKVPRPAWPAESLGARRGRIQAGIATIATVSTRDFWEAPNVEPVAAKDQVSYLDHLVRLYDSCGADRMTFNPSVSPGIVTYVPRRDHFGIRGMAGLVWNQAPQAAARNGLGAYIRSYAVTPAGGSAGEACYLDAAGLEHDDDAAISRRARITRAAVSHPDAGAATPYDTRTIEASVPGTNELLIGERVAQLDSSVAWNAYADVALSDLTALCQKEAAAWELPTLRWRTRKTNGLEVARQGRLLLRGYEQNSVVFLQRSWLSHDYGIRPIFGVMGGVIGYRDGGWDIEVQLAPVVTTLRQHAIAWNEVDDGSAGFQVQWHDEPHPQGMHESVTYEDLAHCATGMNVTIIPPDTGWDRYQS